MKDTTFKMAGFPQHAGVSPVKDDVKIGTNIKSSAKSALGTSKFKKPPTKIEKFLAKHPKINKGVDKVKDGVDKVKDVATNAWEKANEFAKTDAGKAVIAGLTEKATAPRPKKETLAIIQSEQKSIM